MTEAFTRPVVWLLQQAPTLPDTFVMKTVTAERGWFETVTGIASGGGFAHRGTVRRRDVRPPTTRCNR